MTPGRLVLQAMGDGEPWTVPEIAHRIGHPPNNVRGIVLRYERAGMVTRCGRRAPDGRGRPPYLFARVVSKQRETERDKGHRRQ